MRRHHVSRFVPVRVCAEAPIRVVELRNHVTEAIKKIYHVQPRRQNRLHGITAHVRQNDHVEFAAMALDDVLPVQQESLERGHAVVERVRRPRPLGPSP